MINPSRLSFLKTCVTAALVGFVDVERLIEEPKKLFLDASLSTHGDTYIVEAAPSLIDMYISRGDGSFDHFVGDEKHLWRQDTVDNLPYKETDFVQAPPGFLDD